VSSAIEASPSRRTTPPATPVVEPLSPRRKWRAITLATLLLVPGYWILLAGLVADQSNAKGGPNPAAALALGLAAIPFVFLVLAVMSGRARWPSAVAKAMGMAVLVGLAVSAFAGDAITGIVAGVGAGGCIALRRDDPHSLRTRAVAVAVAAVYTLVLVRSVSVLALLPAPVLPLTAIGVADHVSERRRTRAGG
jgi:hypothetical protein